MRPIHLSMTAFGPFAGTEEIHFEDLGSNPLFLINGPTGSGKTTILDAICFALYGKSTGDEREGPQMRCDLASPETLTEVSFQFELNGKKYQISRIPEQEQAKKRGEGTTTRSAQAELVELEPNGEKRPIVAKKVKDATLEIENLTGLNADQFRQVMVLPQGKFRQLLMAESKDREQIFSKLFQTQIYKILEDDLKVQAGEIRKEVGQQNTYNQTILESVDLEGYEQLELELKNLKPDWDKAQYQKAQDDQHLIKCNNRLQEGQNLQALFLNLDKSRSLLKDLLNQKPDQEIKQKRLQEAESAQKLRPIFIEVERCQTEYDLANNRKAASKAEKEKARISLDQANDKAKQLGSLTSDLDELKKELVSLNDYSARMLRLAPLRQSRLEAEKAVKQTEEKLKTILGEQTALIQTKTVAESNLQKVQQSLTDLPDKQVELQKLITNRKLHQELHQNIQKAEKQALALKEAETLGKRLSLQYETKEAELKTLELAWHRGQAAILAKELKSDTPCPVCGSTTHPQPATSNDHLPTEDQLRQASKAKDNAFSQLNQARDSYRELNSDKKAVLEKINETKRELGAIAERSPEEIDQMYDLLNQEVTTLKQQKSRIEELSGQLTKLKQDEQRIGENLLKAQQQDSSNKAILAAAIAKEDAANQEIPEKYQQLDFLNSAISAKQDEIKRQEQNIETIQKQQQSSLEAWTIASTTYESAIETCDKSKTTLLNAKKTWDEVLAESPFQDEATYQQALLEQQQIQELKKEIQTYETNLNQLKGASEQQENALKDKLRPDLKLLEKGLEEASTKKELSDKNWQRLNNRMSQLETAVTKIDQGLSKLQKLEEQYALIGTLSDIANGQTGHKISLQRFVLSVLLDDVLIEASHRLKLMSKGRYQLFRKEDRSKGNKASGLDLIVEDAYTGKVRPIATLSGGESFMAALALALGLSDIVQSYAGGIHLDTLFIDEGFGSLDPESLDLAIRTLIDLQSSGRMIGLISHVSDLKELLPTRIDLVSSQNGSRIKIVQN